MSELTQQTCEPCEGGVDPMSTKEAKAYLEDLDQWGLKNVPKIEKEYSFSGFTEAIEFVNEMADIAESEGHHPNIKIDYNTVTVTIWTHAIDGLSKNDFILAAKLDEAANSIRTD